MRPGALQAALGTTRDPAVLVPGSVHAVTTDSTHLASTAEVLAEAARGVGQIDTSSWKGEASDRARETLNALRDRMTGAASALVRASAALSGYADVLLWAQAQASAAIQEWDRGSTCAPAGDDGTPFLDVSPQQKAAQQRLADARAGVHAAAQRATNALNAASEFAPRPGGFWHGVGEQWSLFWHGAREPVESMGVLAWEQNGVRMLIDPEGWLNDRASLILGLWASLNDPKQFAKDLVDWDTWADEPARAAGHLVPDALLALLTAGAGTVASRGATTASRVTGDITEDSADLAARAARDLGDDAGVPFSERGPGGFTEQELARETPGTGPVVFRANANMTAEELSQAIEWVRGANEARLAGALSETGRVAVTDEMRAMSKTEAALERARAAAAGTPYAGVVSHIPDRTWLGDNPAWSFGDHTKPLNSSFAGQVGRFPVGTEPTIFQFRMMDGQIYPEIVEGGLP
jgi:hypothetical protein